MIKNRFTLKLSNRPTITISKLENAQFYTRKSDNEVVLDIGTSQIRLPVSFIKENEPEIQKLIYTLKDVING